jgi:Membrane-bound metallopeptidase
MRSKWSSVVLILLFSMLIPVGSEVSAAKLAMTESVAARLDGTVAAASGTFKSRLRTDYDKLALLQKKELQLDSDLKSASAANNQYAAQVRKRINEIGAARIRQLETAIQKTTDKYQPLFATYDALRDSADLAKSLGNKELAAAIRKQADGMKPAIELARADIRNRKEQLTAAKREIAKQKSGIRDMLKETDAVKKRISAERKAVAALNKQLSPTWSNFTKALGRKDAARATDALGIVLSLCADNVKLKEKMLEMERSIGKTIANADARLRTLL